MTLVDTNVLLDVATDDARWARWSVHQLDAANIRGPVLINAVVYAEFSIGYARIEEADRVLADVGLKLIEIPRAALFLSGRVFRVIVLKEVAAPGYCRISSSAPTPRSHRFRCSRAIRALTGRSAADDSGSRAAVASSIRTMSSSLR
jgi:hypothetical protein